MSLRRIAWLVLLSSAPGCSGPKQGDGFPAEADSGDGSPLSLETMDGGSDAEATPDPSLEPVPCAGVPVAGRCAGDGTVERCLVPTGDGKPTLVRIDCEPHERCETTDRGARCTAEAGGCDPGSSRCRDDGGLERCTTGAEWTDEPCDGECQSSALGAFCAPAIPTHDYSGTLEYEARSVNDALTAWSDATFLAPAQAMLAISTRGSEIIDATRTNAAGHFTLRVPRAAADGNKVVFYALLPDAAGTRPLLAVANPDVDPGLHRIPVAAENAAIWSWTIDPHAVATGSRITIDEESGSGALRVYDFARFAVQSAPSDFGGEPRSVLVWLGFGSDWTCGSCFAPFETTIDGAAFDSQIYLPATTESPAYWSEPAILHELGHWAMASYGVLPAEGGPHCLGFETQPGQAWAEGFATYYSAAKRQSALYYDERGGSMFWLDLETRTYSTGIDWPRPDPTGDAMQPMDENEIAALLWQLSRDRNVGPQAIFDTIASERLTTESLYRGYVAQQWVVQQCRVGDLTDTTRVVPTLVDALDALECATEGSVVGADLPVPYPAGQIVCPAASPTVDAGPR